MAKEEDGNSSILNPKWTNKWSLFLFCKKNQYLKFKISHLIL